MNSQNKNPTNKKAGQAKKTKLNPRVIATLAVNDVATHGKAFNGDLIATIEGNKNRYKKLLGKINVEQLKQDFKQQIDPREQAFFRQLSYGTLRHYYWLEHCIQPFLNKPMARKDQDIYNLLLVGVYQIAGMSTATHAAINETVNAAKALGKNWAGGLINGVLRNLLREHDENDLKEAFQKSTAVTDTTIDNASAIAHAEWMLTKLQQEWPNHWRQICEYNNHGAPMAIRVNQQSNSVSEYLHTLAEAGIKATPYLSSQALLLDNPVNTHLLPEFEQGLCSVQDAGAQLAAELLDVQNGQDILDACAAPGGKTAHISECALNSRIVAIDKDPQRVELIKSNLARIQKRANEVKSYCLDMTSKLAPLLQKNSFDRILVDAPCSSSGVIAHHPDIKLLRREEDIRFFADQQLELLKNIWPLLREGGSLVYSTCSIFSAENDGVIERFVAWLNEQDARANARLQTIDSQSLVSGETWGQATQFGRQLLPIRGKNGGFYYAKLSKAVG